MAVATSTTAFFPEQYGPLLDNVVEAKSIAAQVSSRLGIAGTTVAFPLLTADPDTAWTAEGAQITADDPGLSELVVTPRKVAGLTQLSNEAVNDSNPDVANLVGNSLGRSIAKKVDAAFFSLTAVTNGPTPIGTQAYSTVDTGASLTNLDTFVDAVFVGLENGSEISHFVVSPDTAQAVSKLKEQTGSNRNLVEIVEGGMRIYGRPVLVSADVDAATVAWALDRTQIHYVVRQGTSVVVSDHAVFDYDSVQVRGTMRVGFGFQLPAGIVRLYDAA
ncbi:phage major capsid protein, HK97 family [Saccharopolyspora shandongensis]|uniref:Phage major capsid protein, HK97 family n=1 Tax=Saccharopolyspora shandongensis TaxID=418495 RepID=A0A1H3QFB7_9PSEU|nr:phage major capsid protein [Saccharopolyspora shandongensis]SDZ12086.1 phage major capsid protein, HK97 family [Saccharopolyspora shandongensis]